MNFDPLLASQVVAGTITAGVTLAGYFSGPGALRNRLKSDIDLLDKLPPDSAAHGTLLEHINDQVTGIRSLDQNASRDVQGAAIGGLLVIGFGWLGFFLIGLDDWWWDLTGALTLIFAAAGLSVVYDDLQRVPRDEDGERL